jgi:hypothetical protein
MLSFLYKYGHNVHSQNSEDGVIQECVKRMDLTSGHAVEAGGNDGQWMSNTRVLLENGWSGLFVEANYDLYLKCKSNWASYPKVKSQCSRVDGKNVNAFVNDSCDLLSLDTDGSDYEIFAGLQANPKIVIIEIDSSIPPNDPSFNSDGAAGYFRGVELGLEKGYFLLCHTGNLVFVREDYKHLFPEVKSKHPLIDSEFYFNRAWIKEEAA